MTLSEVVPARAGDVAHPAGSRTRIRVASVPASHVYVSHLQPLHPSAGFPDVVRLPDPDPDDPGRSAVSRWWPPAMLEPAWVRAHADFDVFHVQFGFDARSPEDLRELVSSLRQTGRPLVYTVHDLRNPHHETRALHDAQLDVLIPAADALITLTRGAADEIGRRWGREAIVLPHPHVVPLDRMRRVARRSDGEFRVGVHVKSLRASMNPLQVLEALVGVVRSIPGGVLQVNGHRDVLEHDGARYDAGLAGFLRTASARGAIDLRIHDFLPDDDLWDYLESLDVSVLPYRFGTHSGWLEACRDLGTAVVAPTCGYYADQGPVFSYRNDEDGLDAASLAAAVLSAYEEGAPAPLSPDARAAQRDWIAREHAALYERLLA